jgi:Fe-S cluster assembly protein SufD
VNAAELPNRRVEAWKYSDLRAAMEGVGEGVMARAAPAASPIEALARAGAGEERFLTIEAGQVHELQHGVVGLEAGAVARITAPIGQTGVLIEPFLGGQTFSAGLTSIDVEEGARLTRIVIQKEGAKAASGDQFRDVVLSEARVRLAAGASFKQFVLAEGAKLARIETHVVVAGAGGEVELNGVYLAGAGRHVDLTSVITHAQGGGVTRQLIKGVARKGGRGVFQGRIEVARGAQNTDARQYHHGMLLEDGAEIFAKPELMIHADDVQCAHGNTAGGLDQGALFYLRARGVGEHEARALLIEAFLADAIPDHLPGEIRLDLVARIRRWLGGAS